MSKLTTVALAVCLSFTTTIARAHEPAAESVPPEAARALLVEGNTRYATSAVRPRRYRAERPALAKGQHPYAAVLSCADSRVPPEIVFDESLGRLFVVRVAGNVADPTELASLEYAAEHLGTRYLLVLGHASCGAVKAAFDAADPTPNLGTLLKEIRPAVASAKAASPSAKDSDLTGAAVKENVRLQVKNVTEKSELLRKAVADGKFAVAGAVYDLASGKVEWLDADAKPAAAAPKK